MTSATTLSVPTRPTIHIEECSQQRVGQLRSSQAARDVGNGWLMIDDRNLIGNSILLISRHQSTYVRFRHGQPYHEHMRAYAYALEYADQFPQAAAAGAQPERELVVTSLFQLQSSQFDEEVVDQAPACSILMTEGSP